MQSMLYSFRCPRCGMKVASDESVMITTWNTSDGAIRRVRVLGSNRLLHECATEAPLLRPSERATGDRLTA